MIFQKSLTLSIAALAVISNLCAGNVLAKPDTDMRTPQEAQNNKPIDLESGKYSKQEAIDRLNQVQQQRRSESASRLRYRIICGMGLEQQINTFNGYGSIPSAVSWVEQHCSEPIVIQLLSM